MSYWQRPGLQAIPPEQKSDALFLSRFAHDECDPIIDHRLVDQLQACRQKRLLGFSPACLYNTAGYKQTTWSYYLRKLGAIPPLILARIFTSTIAYLPALRPCSASSSLPRNTGIFSLKLF